MTNDIKYTLRTPVNHDGMTLSEVTFREPTLGDLIAVEELGVGDTAQLGHLMARMAGIPFEVFCRISSRDAQAMKKLTDKAFGEDAAGNDRKGGVTSPS